MSRPIGTPGLQAGEDVSTYTPAAIARSHALATLVAWAEGSVATNSANLAALPDTTSDDDRAYLTVYIATMRSVADRLRNSPGYQG